LKERLEQEDNTWSKTILNYWNSLPPTLLKVIFKSVKQSETMTPFDILALEKKLNSKWRQTQDYKEWLRSKNNWTDDNVDFYFKDLELPLTSADEVVVYEAPQETEEDTVPMVCPVTGQKSSATASCPVGGDKMAGTGANVCPVTGQCGDIDMNSAAAANGKCPYINRNVQADTAVCPVTGQKAADEVKIDGEAAEGKCPYINGQIKEDKAVCPVSGQTSSTAEGEEKSAFLKSKQNENITSELENLTLEPK
jgi:hypothetical protein